MKINENHLVAAFWILVVGAIIVVKTGLYDYIVEKINQRGSVVTIFGERLNYYDKTLVDWMNDRVKSCSNDDTKEDGRIIRNIRPKKSSSFFDEYRAHLLPVTRKTFLISGVKSFDPSKLERELKSYPVFSLGRGSSSSRDSLSPKEYARQRAESHYREVIEILRLKYGEPIIEKPFAMTFQDGDVLIGLVCTDITGVPMVYINAYMPKLFDIDLQKEVLEYKTRYDPNFRAL